jgi:hypothetical protein
MGTQSLGKLLIVIGGVVILLGLILTFGKNLSFLGRLPGDIRIERPNLTIYIPITSCILLSILLSAISYLISRLR